MTDEQIPRHVENTVLIEHERGVTEISLKGSQFESMLILVPTHVRSVSGSHAPIATDQIVEAVQLGDWAEQNQSVIEDCRVQNQAATRDCN